MPPNGALPRAHEAAKIYLGRNHNLVPLRYALKIEYLGSRYAGWQVQPNQRTVQSEIEQALSVVCRHPCKITGAGRTDAGVHALGQVAHFDLPHELDTHRVLRSLNGILEEDIAILRLNRVTNDFHSRFDAIQREYGYYLSVGKVAIAGRTTHCINHALDFGSMNAAAALLVCKDDFSSFCITKSETTNRVCDIRHANWHQQSDGRWKYSVKGDRFLHGMVRAMVGTLIQVGKGQRDPLEMSKILDSRDRTAAGPAAPAHGLILEAVRYPGDV